MNIRERAEEEINSIQEIDKSNYEKELCRVIRDLLAELKAYEEDHEGEDVYELIKKIQTLRVDKDDLLAENERWKNSYKNMRDFAVRSGLDIIAEGVNEQ